jgi:hypothetical protein
MWKFGGKQHTNKALQLLIHDELTAEFRTLPNRNTFIFEEEDDEPIYGWKHLFSNLWDFEGGEGLPAGKVTISTERDYLMELIPGIIPESQKPDKSQKKEIVNKATGIVEEADAFLVEVGESRAADILVEKMKSTSYEKVTQWLGIALLGMIVAVIIKIIMRQLGG